MDKKKNADSIFFSNLLKDCEADLTLKSGETLYLDTRDDEVSSILPFIEGFIKYRNLYIRCSEIVTLRTYNKKTIFDD